MHVHQQHACQRRQRLHAHATLACAVSCHASGRPRNPQRAQARASGARFVLAAELSAFALGASPDDKPLYGCVMPTNRLAERSTRRNVLS
jgi:hypothetical protein